MIGGDDLYYDGTKLLSMKDINGNTPEIYGCIGNRSSGKTTFFGRYFVNRFIKHGEKFVTLYRYNYELDECANKFFNELHNLFFPSYYMESKRRAKGIFHELLLNEESCGYALALNSADQIKKYSHLFADSRRILFDEFMSETNHYCSDECRKFISVHFSLARGGGEQVRYLPVYMLSNTVSLLNPYFVALGISTRLQKHTKFLKGDGFVFEQNFNDSVSEKQSMSGFNRSFKNNSYLDYASQNIYLNDNLSFIENVRGKSSYIATIKYLNKYYGVREFLDSGIIYISDKADTTYPVKISATTDDHTINYIYLKQYNTLIKTLRFYFEHGCMRFKNINCKEAIINIISY